MAPAAAPYRGRRRRLFALATAGFLILVQELAFRGLFPIPEVAVFNRMRYQPLDFTNPNILKALQRGLVYDRLRLESEPDGFSEVHDLNQYGFRGSDFAVDPPRDRPRILLIGDSVVEGQGAPVSATLSAELSRLLAASGKPAEVINLGVIAANLEQVTFLVRDAASFLKPTQIVVVLYANDMPVSTYPKELDLPAPGFPRRDTPFWMPRGFELMGRILRKEPIYRRWFHTPIPFFAAVPDRTNPWTATKEPPADVDPAIYRAMVAGTVNPWLRHQADGLPGMLSRDLKRGGSPVVHVVRMIEACRPAEAQLILAYVPFCGTVHPRYAPSLVKVGMSPDVAQALAVDPIYRRQQEHLAELSTRLKLPLADATEDLKRAEEAGSPQYWPYDTHPRPAGYATIARCIFGVLRDHLPNDRPGKNGQVSEE
jgi:lysophospholipase L1-like esterase